MQDFPWKTDACKGKKSSVFENDLVEYLTALEVKCKILQKKNPYHQITEIVGGLIMMYFLCAIFCLSLYSGNDTFVCNFVKH